MRTPGDSRLTPPQRGAPGASGVAVAPGAMPARPAACVFLCVCSARKYRQNSTPATCAGRAVTATVLSALLNLREQPNTNAVVVAQLKARDVLLVLEEVDGWLRVQTCDAFYSESQQVRRRKKMPPCVDMVAVPRGRSHADAVTRPRRGVQMSGWVRTRSARKVFVRIDSEQDPAAGAGRRGCCSLCCVFLGMIMCAYALCLGATIATFGVWMIDEKN